MRIETVKVRNIGEHIMGIIMGGSRGGSRDGSYQAEKLEQRTHGLDHAAFKATRGK